MTSVWSGRKVCAWHSNSQSASVGWHYMHRPEDVKGGLALSGGSASAR